MCADVNSLTTYLSDVQVLEPNEFSDSISYLDHLNLSLNEWSLYYENDYDVALGYSSVISVIDFE